MQIQTLNQGAVTLVRPQGPVSGEDAEALKARLIEAIRQHLGRVALDLSTVPFVDSRGLEVLVEVSQELGRRGQTLKLSGVSGTLREVLEVTKLADQFEHFADANAAVRSFL